MSAPSVRLLLKGQLLSEVPFHTPLLRIGRMKENEVVINNLSVSRFHATLTREDDGFVLRDLGSENGCWVNGQRVSEARVGPADAIQIGKHELELVASVAGAQDEVAAAEPPPRGRSDAWDASNTYLVGLDTQAKMLGHAAPDPRAADAEEPPFAAEADGEQAFAAAAAAVDAPLEAELVAPDDDGAELFGEGDPGDLAAPDLAEFDVSELEVGAEPSEAELAAEQEPAGAVDADDEATLLVAELPGAAAPAFSETGPPVAAAALHAGVIVQRAGRLESVVPWEGDRLILGRGADCDIVLGTAEVSRRHALLVRDGDRHEVRDLESINGTYVNNERVGRRALEVGDVIRIEDFELTFVLDRAPLGEAVQPAPAPPTTGGDSGDLTQLGELLDLAPFMVEESDGANAMSFDAAPPAPEPLPEPAVLAPDASEPELPEQALEPGAAPPVLSFDAEASGEDLLVEGDFAPGDDDKDLAPSPLEAGRTVRFELAVRVEELPPALREALGALDEADLRLPVELRLARD